LPVANGGAEYYNHNCPFRNRLARFRAEARVVALLVRIYYNAVFGALGGLLGWMLFGVFGDKNPTEATQWLQMIIGGTLIGGAVGYFVVSVDAVRDQALARFARLATYGAGLGALGGAAGMYLGDWVNTALVTATADPTNVLIAVLARGLGWTFLGIAIGMSEGFAARSLGKFSYGTLGGALGGFIGGCIFGLLYALSIQGSGGDSGATYFGNALGLVILGACIGSLSALVQGVFQPASVKVMRGWQEGREYALDKPAVLLGRDEHADIPLFRDMKVEKKHAFIKRVGKQYVLVNNRAPAEHTLVNEKPVPHSVELNDGDRIQLGNVILRFQARAAVNRPKMHRRPAGAIAAPAPAGAIVRRPGRG
jgi:hypothetical protein